MQKKKAIITRDILKAKAVEIWRGLPQYRGGAKEMPPWSSGWLAGFKKRYKIKEYVYHREGASIEIDKPKQII